MSLVRPLALALAAATTVAAAAAPVAKDFAHGFDLVTMSEAPVQQVTVPDAVYERITRADLGDLRVFNGGGIVVPHALCTGPQASPDTVREQSLPVFPLRSPAARVPADSRVMVQTPGGTSVQVTEGPAGPALVPVTPQPSDGFVVDASGVDGDIRALRLAWNTADDASEAHVRVEASEDLNAWRPVVPGTTLFHVAADGRALDRSHVDLPPARYKYLRLVRGGGPAVSIGAVTAEVVHAGAAAEPQWFAALPVAATEAEGFVFDAGRLAPVHVARIVLSTSNMALRIGVDSRAGPEQPWRERWNGEVSSVNGGNAAQTPAFPPVPDREWRLRVLRGAETLGGGRPSLRLGYHPARLRFLAQGDGPYVLAYASARVPPAETIACDGLLPPRTPDEGSSLIGVALAEPAPAGAFGGPEVLAPPPRPTPTRQIVLWVVLLVGAAALVAMALSLLKRLREGNPPG